MARQTYRLNIKNHGTDISTNGSMIKTLKYLRYE